MEGYDLNCAICGCNTTRKVLRIGVPTNRPEILLRWKKECMKSLCEILFGSDFQNIFHEYFEQGSYCTHCLQTVWTIDFTWKSLMERKREIEKQSAAVQALLSKKFNSRKNKSSTSAIKERIASLDYNVQNDYSADEVLEMICSVIQSKWGTKLTDSSVPSVAPIQKVEHLVDVKEEILESEFPNENMHFDSGGEDWLTENTADEPVLTELDILRRPKKEIEMFNRPKLSDASDDGTESNDDDTLETISIRKAKKLKNYDSSAIKEEERKKQSGNLRSVQGLTEPVILRRRKQKVKRLSRPKRRSGAHQKSYRDLENSSSDTDPEYPNSKANDKDYRPPLPKKPEPKINEKFKPLPRGKRKQDLGLLAYELSEISDDETESNDDDTLETISKRKAKKLKMSNLKSYVNSGLKEEERKRQSENLRCGQGLQTDIILEDSDLLILEKLANRDFRTKYFQFRSLDESEMNLLNKLCEYSRTSIQRLKLTGKQQNNILNLRTKLMKRKRSFKSGKLQRPIFSCERENCKAKLKTEEELEGHVREIHEGEEFPFYCTTCPKRFKKYGNVKSHRRKTHKSIKRFYYHFCKICLKGYKTEEEYKTHSENAHQGVNPFSCAFCPEEYTTSADLSRHVSEAHFELTPEESEKIRKLTCDKCGKWFFKESHLRKHLPCQDIPQIVKSVHCDQCERSFSTESILKSHIESRHTYVVCETCGKSVSKAGFTKHQRRHTGELRFACTLCSKRFIRSDQCSDHERTHSGIRSFICSVCGAAFFTKSVLQGHELIHQPGYVPRKPFRRSKPNRKKIIPKESPVSKPFCEEDPLEVNHEKVEPPYPHDNYSRNSDVIQPPQYVVLGNVYPHPPGFVYPL